MARRAHSTRNISSKQFKSKTYPGVRRLLWRLSAERDIELEQWGGLVVLRAQPLQPEPDVPPRGDARGDDHVKLRMVLGVFWEIALVHPARATLFQSLCSRADLDSKSALSTLPTLLMKQRWVRARGMIGVAHMAMRLACLMRLLSPS